MLWLTVVISILIDIDNNRIKVITYVDKVVILIKGMFSIQCSGSTQSKKLVLYTTKALYHLGSRIVKFAFKNRLNI